MPTTAKLVTSLLLVALVSACGRGEVREWTPADHDQEEGAQASPASSSRGPRRSSAEDAAQVVEVTWAKQCASCHGLGGRGDGPTGPMVNAPDLTRPDWQSKVTDDEIAKTIVAGRGKMPPNPLPPPIVAGLVKRVRQLRGR